MWAGWVENLPSSCPHLTTVNQGVQLIRIPTSIQVNWETSQMRANTLSAVTKKLKKPTAEQIDQQVGKLGLGLDSFGGRATGQEEMGQAMLKNAGSGFSGIGQTFGDITALLPSQNADEDDDDGKKDGAKDMGADADEGEDDIGESPSKKARKAAQPDPDKPDKYRYKDGFVCDNLPKLQEIWDDCKEEVRAAKVALEKELLVHSMCSDCAI